MVIRYSVEKSAPFAEFCVFGIARFKIRNRTEFWKKCFKVILVSFFVLEWCKMIFQKFFLSLNTGKNSECFSLRRNGSKGIPSIFIFRSTEFRAFLIHETDRILTKWIKISVCSVFHGIIFFSEKWKWLLTGSALLLHHDTVHDSSSFFIWWISLLSWSFFRI